MYDLVINLLGLPQYKHVGEVFKIKFLHWGLFFFHNLILLNKIEIRNIIKISNLNIIYYIFKKLNIIAKRNFIQTI